MTRLSKFATIEAVLDGLEDGVIEYYKASGWEIYNNEAFLCSSIFKSIIHTYRNRSSTWVTLEQPIGQMKEYSRARPGRLPKILEGSLRHDIVMWVDGDEPYCVVEVKAHPGARSTQGIAKDVNRIKALLKRKRFQTLRFGLLACYYRYDKPDSYENIEAKLRGVRGSDDGFHFDFKKRKLRRVDDDMVGGEVCVFAISYRNTKD